MQFVQLVLTDDQSALLAQALPLLLDNEAVVEEYLGGEDVVDDLKRLAVFFAGVATEPSRFPVNHQMAGTLKKRVRRLKNPIPRRSDGGVKGEPQPKSPRKQRQERRMRTAKGRRRTRREDARAFNEARERYERDVAEMQEMQAQTEARIHELLGSKRLAHEELIELLALLGASDLAKKSGELYRSEHDPQAAIDAAAQAAR